MGEQNISTENSSIRSTQLDDSAKETDEKLKTIMKEPGSSGARKRKRKEPIKEGDSAENKGARDKKRRKENSTEKSTLLIGLSGTAISTSGISKKAILNLIKKPEKLMFSATSSRDVNNEQGLSNQIVMKDNLSLEESLKNATMINSPLSLPFNESIIDLTDETPICNRLKKLQYSNENRINTNNNAFSIHQSIPYSLILQSSKPSVPNISSSVSNHHPTYQYLNQSNVSRLVNSSDISSFNNLNNNNSTPSDHSQSLDRLNSFPCEFVKPQSIPTTQSPSPSFNSKLREHVEMMTPQQRQQFKLLLREQLYQCQQPIPNTPDVKPIPLPLTSSSLSTDLHNSLFPSLFPPSCSSHHPQ